MIAASRWAAVAALCLLTACAERAPAPPQGPVFRVSGAPLASVALFDAARFSGSWVQQAHFPGGCAGEKVLLRPAPGGYAAQRLCAGGLSDQALHLTAPGRLEGPDGGLWVLWVDEGYRTAVVARPDGRWAAIWDRSEQIPADRMAAARALLDFNGYDMSRLQED